VYYTALATKPHDTVVGINITINSAVAINRIEVPTGRHIVADDMRSIIIIVGGKNSRTIMIL